MLLPLAHGSGLELIIWLAYLLVLLAAWLVIVAIASLVFALLYGPVLLVVVRRGRFLLPLMPLVNIATFLLVDPAGRVSLWINQPFLTPVVLRASGWVVAGLCGLITAAFLAGTGRAVRGVRGRVTDQGTAPRTVPTVVPLTHVSLSKSTDFREGLQAPLDGLRYLGEHRELWQYAVLPIALNLLITAFVLLILIAAGAWFVEQIHPKFSPTWWGTVLEVFAGAGILVIALALAAAAWLALNGILCGYFYAKLARQVELQLGTRPDEMFEVPLRHQIIDTLRDLGALLVINAALLPLNLVPLVGSLLALVLGFYFNGFIFGADYLDFPLSLRGLRRNAKRAICRAHRWQTIGLGTGVFAFNLVPIIGSILNAGAAVGAVLLFHRWPQSPIHPGSAGAAAAAAV